MDMTLINTIKYNISDMLSSDSMTLHDLIGSASLFLVNWTSQITSR
jgi:hypothetical protein